MRGLGIGAVALLTAAGALYLLHREVAPAPALGCAAVAGLAVLALRSVWSHLPPFVTAWLGLGTAVTVTLLAAAATGTSRGWPYAVLRWSELSALTGSASLVGVATGSLAYTHHRLAREVAAQARRVAEAERLALEARLAALSAQINPHFLFNVLNTLAELVHEDEDRAEEGITDLAALMRHALKGTAAPVPLAEELDAVRRVLRLESARLGDRLRWRVDADPDLASVPIPALLVQPLVENAVRHAVATRVEGGTVAVEVGRDGDQVRIVVADDGPGLPEPLAAALDGRAPWPLGSGSAGAGGGLRNVAERTRLSWATGRLSRDPDAPGTRLVLLFPREGR